MQGILGAVGKALITLQEAGEVIIEKTDELYLDEITYYVEETLKGVKAAYKIEEIEPKVKLKITLQ
ncbi:hypothetical protein QNH20_07895 [Neobacillus sp. WH10]|uniref:hypothetical protein n=1 Tax=Neobacillus sp. WH10 TaxID=3047873 RepID=UPI0024C14ABA|nr:hypothetical protein [Neobacillus sp. WH10]WHY79040.1 hypothetical protein QNH20_07895 [Neobacillus sp. WH10]